MKKYCFALDLQDDSKSIAEYKACHQKVWPEIIKSIKEAGVDKLDIYFAKNNLFSTI